MEDPACSIWKRWIVWREVFSNTMHRNGLNEQEISEALSYIMNHWPTEPRRVDREFIETLPANSPLLQWRKSEHIHWDKKQCKYKSDVHVPPDELASLREFEQALEQYKLKLHDEYQQKHASAQ